MWSTTRREGKLFLNDNGAAKGWGEKKVGGLVAKFKGKPKLSADQFDGLTAHGGDAITGGGGQQGADIKDQISSLREGLTESKVSELYGEMLIDPQKGIKSISKTAKKAGYKFNQAELGAALNEMDEAGAFSNVELDDAALTTLLGLGGEQQQGANTAS